MDFFKECIIKKKKTMQDVMSVVITLMVGIMVFYCIFLQAASGKLVLAVPMEFAAVVYLMYRIITSMNVEFEYSVTNGDIDIDKIISKRQRKRLVSLKLRNVEYFAPFEDEYIKVAEDSGVKKVIDASGGVGASGLYFAIYYNNNEKTCLLFEPTDEMIENFYNYIPRSLNHTKE